MDVVVPVWSVYIVALLAVAVGLSSRRGAETVRSAGLPLSVQRIGVWSAYPSLTLYDARQNLRLSHHFGPVVLLQQGSYTLLTSIRNLLSFRQSSRTSVPSKLSDTVILVNSAQHAKVLLERHGATYSSRGPSIAASKYLSDGRRIVLLPYGAQWRSHHKALVQLLLKDKIQHKWRKALQHEALVLITNIARDPAATLDQVSRYTASSVLQIAYSRRAVSVQDSVIKDLEQVSRNVADAFAPSKNLVELYPILDLLPTWLAPWKTKLLQDHTYEAKLYGDLVDHVERRMTTDCVEESRTEDRSVIPVSECCAAELLRLLETDANLDRKDIAYICATVFEAGSETTAMTINTFLLAAALHPDLIDRAQAELDTALASFDESKLPGFHLMDATPLVNAFVKECLRLTPTGSSGVAHTSSRTTGHDTVDMPADGHGLSSQCIVPAGATILPNIYGIHHDHAVYPDPWSFNPDRFLTPTSAVGHHHHAFGFGRRICPGLDLATNSLYIAISYLVWAFHFHIIPAASQELVAKVKRIYQSEHENFCRLFPQTSSSRSSEMDSLTPAQLLLDAYTNHIITRAELTSCISLTVRDAARLEAVAQTLKEINAD